MSLESFFKKDFAVYPSGKTPHDRGVKISKYAKTLAGMTGTAAMAVLMASCTQTYSEIDAVKAAVPEKEQTEIKLTYDESLLHKIDSLRLDAGHDMNASVSMAIKEMEKTLPSDTARWTPQDYVRSDHAQKRRNEALPQGFKFGKFDFKRINSDFRDDLRKEVQKEKKALGNESVSVKVVSAKAVSR